ncbi:MAG: WecB/TagA/CpsF family glycosyltransferase, partial [Rubrimonas sp.]
EPDPFVFPQTPVGTTRMALAQVINVGTDETTVTAVEASGAQVTLLAVGSPQQELLAAALAENGRAGGVGLCIGAGLEFLVGAKKRAPDFMQRMGLEWAFRLMSEPRRLWRRYLVDGIRIFPIFVAEWSRMRARRPEAIS